MSYEYSGIQVFWEKLDIFCKDCKYLGKSKATEVDSGKLCKFWNNSDEQYATYGILLKKWNDNGIIFYTLKKSGAIFNHARRLTKQEIEELC